MPGSDVVAALIALGVSLITGGITFGIVKQKSKDTADSLKGCQAAEVVNNAGVSEKMVSLSTNVATATTNIQNLTKSVDRMLETIDTRDNQHEQQLTRIHLRIDALYANRSDPGRP